MVSRLEVPAVNSPRVGLQRLLKLVVDSSNANGEIGFDSADVVEETEPPAGSGAKRVPIRITREGVNGVAAIAWTARGWGERERETERERTDTQKHTELKEEQS